MASEPTTQRRRRQRQRLLTIDTETGERHASWLELFFDLVFVIAVSHVAAVLSAETNAVGLLKFTVLFFSVWWVWVGHTFYADRFESDEHEYRILTFAGMLSVAALALRIETAFTPQGSDAFAVFYSIVLSILAANYARTAIYVPLARKLAVQYVIGLGCSASIFLVSLLFDPPAQFAIWAIGLAVAVATPFLSPKLARVIPIDYSHIPERFGLFTIIVLGEAVIATAHGAAGVPWTLVSALTAVFGFGMAACIWWLNFEFVEDDAIKQPVLLPRIVYLFGHFFIVSSIVALGIGIEHAIKESGEALLHTPTIFLLGGSVAIFLAAITVVRIVSGVYSLVYVRFGAVALSLAIAAAGLFVSPIMVVTGLLGVLVGSVLVEIRLNDSEISETMQLLPCAHGGEAVVFEPRSQEGCEECVKNNYKWVHLRLCLSCGHVGCCESSRFNHATKHYQKEDHPLIASLEDNESWSWCYADERYVPLQNHIGKYRPAKIELVEKEES
jgi:low temperature requirement protein LtrA